MDKLSEYEKRYQELKAHMEDLPPRPRSGILLFLAYLTAETVICYSKGPQWLMVVTTLIFIIIYYDVRQGIYQKPRHGPD